tara:strand:- start:1237 stop:1761 length:525 start_codon:yes stop_codon:yes gene_type:complete
MQILYILISLLLIIFLCQKVEFLTNKKEYIDNKDPKIKSNFLYFHIFVKEDKKNVKRTLTTFMNKDGLRQLHFTDYKKSLQDFFLFELEKEDDKFYLKTSNGLYVHLDETMKSTNSKNEKFLHKSKPEKPFTITLAQDTPVGTSYKIKEFFDVFIEASKKLLPPKANNEKEKVS